jgi:hypothetical protein
LDFKVIVNGIAFFFLTAAKEVIVTRACLACGLKLFEKIRKGLKLLGVLSDVLKQLENLKVEGLWTNVQFKFRFKGCVTPKKIENSGFRMGFENSGALPYICD